MLAAQVLEKGVVHRSIFLFVNAIFGAFPSTQLLFAVAFVQAPGPIIVHIRA